MPALVAGIHDFLQTSSKTWMAGTSPAMTGQTLSALRVVDAESEKNFLR
jgi:hypothetical protein